MTIAAAPHAQHRGAAELPFVEIGGGNKLKVIQVDVAEGLWIVENIFQTGYAVQTHRHTGPVYAYTMSGAWRYREYEYVNRAGSFLFEPAGSVHTLECVEDDTQVWFQPRASPAPTSWSAESAASAAHHATRAGWSPVSAVDAAAVAAAAAGLASVVTTTPLHPSERLGTELGRPVWLKREDQQVGRSYKFRGAFTVVSSLDDRERALGVVCASAGNHALGVAHSCRLLGVRARVFLPTTTPRQKRQQLQAVGGDLVEAVVTGATFAEASAAAREDSGATGAVYVHAFDDARTIAGQGTVAVEVTAQAPGPVGTLVVPVGGGGLLAGMAVWFRAHSPATRLVGVEPAGAPSMTAALGAGGPVAVVSTDRFVEGAAVERVGDLTYPLVRDLVDEVVVVPEGAVATEMLDLYQVDGVIAEPAGALATAAVRRLDDLHAGPVVCVVSGGNNDVSRYAETIERSLVHEGLRHYFLVTFPQEPGALRHFLDEVLGAGDDIVLFEYVKKSNKDTGPALVGVELERPDDLDGLLGRMAASPLSIERVPPDSPLSLFLL